MNEQEILRELSNVMDALGALPADAFTERSPLTKRQAELRSLLAAAQEEAGRDATEAWADQAARKPSEDAQAFIETHLPDSSGSGGL